MIAKEWRNKNPDNKKTAYSSKILGVLTEV